MRVQVMQARHPMGRFSIGHVIEDMPEGQARDLIRRGIVSEFPTMREVVRSGDYVTRAPKAKRQA